MSLVAGVKAPHSVTERPEKESGSMLEQTCSEKDKSLMDHLSRDFPIRLQSAKKM